MPGLTQTQISSFNDNGFLFPLRAFSTAEARNLRHRLEEAEAAAEPGAERLARQGLPITHAWAWDLVHDPRIVAPIAAVLGPDVLLWSMDWFIKAPGPGFVSYHQDATYWGLEPHHVATAWIALSDAGPETGPMRFLPGSHKGPLYEQDDTYGPDNLLSRGQEVKTEVDESKTVLAPLAPGEMSLHHVRVIHGSEPNLTADRRIGMVLRYCATDVRQTKVAGDRAILVKGTDNYRHFEMIPRPGEAPGRRERELARLHGRTRHQALMEDSQTRKHDPGVRGGSRNGRRMVDTGRHDGIPCGLVGPSTHRRVRVLHVYRTYFPETQGGLEETIRQICLNTAPLGVVSRVLCTSETIEPRIVRRNEADVYRARRTGEVASCSLSVDAFPLFRRLLRWADVVHYHFPWPLADVMHFIGRVRVPTVVTYHSDIVRQRLLGRLYAPLMRRFLGSVDRIVCTSPNYLASSEVLKTFGDAVAVVPIGLDEGSYPPPTDSLLARTHAEYGSGFFLFIGVLRYYKCLHILLEAMRGAPYRAVIVGTGPEERDLKNQCRRLGLGNVTFAGYLSDPVKVALLKRCRAVVSPSYLRAEAFGVSLLEGAMTGKPMVTAEIGSGTSHVNIHGETGLVVQPRSPKAFRAAMDTLHREPELAQTLGVGARRRFQRLFNGRLMGERYADIYGALHGNPD